MDAIQLLRQDHRDVATMFEVYQGLRSDARKLELATRICDALEVHTAIEEEIFYPEVREALGLRDLLAEAAMEHASVKSLIVQVRASLPDEDPLYDAKVKVLGEHIRHHVKEEQAGLFPQVAKSRVDVAALGARLAARKGELMAQIETGALD
jgi:hemerythrin-like domain-containing protein